MITNQCKPSWGVRERAGPSLKIGFLEVQQKDKGAELYKSLEVPSNSVKVSLRLIATFYLK